MTALEDAARDYVEARDAMVAVPSLQSKRDERARVDMAYERLELAVKGPKPAPTGRLL